MTLEVDRTPDGVACVTVPPAPAPGAIWPTLELEKEFLAIVDEPETRALVVDLGRLDFAGTSLISLLVQMHIKARRRNKPHFICSVGKFVCDVLKATRLNRVLDLCEDRNEALDNARSSLDD